MTFFLSSKYDVILCVLVAVGLRRSLCTFVRLGRLYAHVNPLQAKHLPNVEEVPWLTPRLK